MKQLDLDPRQVTVKLFIEYHIKNSDDLQNYKMEVLLEDAMRLLNIFLINPALQLDFFSISEFIITPSINPKN